MPTSHSQLRFVIYESFNQTKATAGVSRTKWYTQACGGCSETKDNFHKVINTAYRFSTINNPLKNFELAKVS